MMPNDTSSETVRKGRTLRWLATFAVVLLVGSPVARGTIEASGDEPVSMPQPSLVDRHEDQLLVLDGQVVGSSGEPIAGAEIAVLAALADAFIPPTGSVVLAEAVSSNDGTFRISTPSVPHWQRKKIWVVARHSRHAFANLRLDDGRLQQSIRLELGNARSVRGSIIGPDGRPLGGAGVRLIAFAGKESFASVENTPRFDAWPSEVRTNPDGTFELKEIPTADDAIRLTVEVSHEKFATQQLPMNVMTDRKDAAQDAPSPIQLQLEPLRVIRGIVVGRDNQQPIADAWMQVVTTDSNQTGDLHHKGRIAKTDGDGRFECRCTPASNMVIYVYPPTGSPYPAFVHSNRAWPQGKSVARRRIEVPRGVEIDGRVVDQNGEPVEGAILTYWVQRQKRERLPQVSGHDADMVYWASEERRIVSGSDGTFEVAVLPGPGYLLAKAPSPDFVSRHISYGEVLSNEPAGFLFNIEAAMKINPAYKAKSASVIVKMQVGVQVELVVQRPDGQPVSDALLLDPHFTQNRNKYDASSTYRSIPVRNGAVTVRGIDRSAPKEVYVLDVKNQLGAVVSLTKEDCETGRRMVKLQPCGSARAQLVDEQGVPMAERVIYGNGLHLDVLLLARGPGNNAVDNWNDDISGYPLMRFVNWRMTGLDKPRHRSLMTDGDGFVTFPTLIPGADYLLTRIIPTYRVLDKIDPKSKEVVHLGQIRMELAGDDE